VIHTLEASTRCLFNSASFEGSVLKVINLSGDTDTTGAAADSPTGIHYRLPAIPGGWIKPIALNQNKTVDLCIIMYRAWRMGESRKNSKARLNPDASTKDPFKIQGLIPVTGCREKLIP
jgi:hypothetical protein